MVMIQGAITLREPEGDDQRDGLKIIHMARPEGCETWVPVVEITPVHADEGWLSGSWCLSKIDGDSINGYELYVRVEPRR